MSGPSEMKRSTGPGSGGLRVVSVCSSVGGLDLGLHRAGHTTVAFCEAEPWRRDVLNRHWPGVPVHHDLKELRACDLPPCDVLVGGTPCQDLSHAGRRAGLDGERSGLFHAFAQLRIDLYERHGCAWSLWENVAGALSSNDGRDFATVLASHVGADVVVPAGGWPGAGVAVGPWGAAEWRLLDAQYFGVPQRRRRVFVVGHLGAQGALEVLADPARRVGHPAPRGEARTDAAPGLAHRAQGAVSHTLTAEGFDASEDGTGRGTPLVAATLTSGQSSEGVSAPGRRQEDDVNIVASALDTMRGGADDNDAQARHIVAQAITARTGKGPDSDCGTGQVVSPLMARSSRGKPQTLSPGHQTDDHIVASTLRSHPRPGSNSDGAITFDAEFSNQAEPTEQGAPAGTLTRKLRKAMQQGSVVRRLTPTECERLMGWPDGWTYSDGPSLLDGAHDDRGDIPPDGRRYSACGDGVVANVAEWIGLRLTHHLETEAMTDAA